MNIFVFNKSADNGEPMDRSRFSKISDNGLLTLSLPRVTNFKFLLQPHQKYNITQKGELGYS